MTVLAAPSASVVGEIIDESIAFGAIKSSFVIISKRPSDRDACGLRIFMIQNQGPHSARVPSHSVTTWMRLASDMRARCAFNRLTLGVHIQGATAERGGAVGSRHPGARTGLDGSDEAARSSQVTTASV